MAKVKKGIKGVLTDHVTYGDLLLAGLVLVILNILERVILWLK